MTPGAIRQLALPFIHAPVYAGADFVPAPSNEEARSWLDLTTDWPGGRLALWGAEGSGKTHLLHRWAARHDAALLCPATLGSILHATRAAAAAPTQPVALDDADFIAERPLLHFLNTAAEVGRPVLLAGRAPPARWPVLLPDLASRLRATVAIRIQPPEDGLLAALLAHLMSDRQLAIPTPVQAALLARLPRNPAALREAVARLDHLALAAGGRVTKALALAVAAEIAGEEKDDDFASDPQPPSQADPRLF